MTVELHVGYVGITDDGDRVEILDHVYPESKYGYFVGSNNACYWANGMGDRTRQLKTDIVGPWIEPETQEPGPWIGWNGGECPVHPDTVVEYAFIGQAGVDMDRECAGRMDWSDSFEPIIAYYVIKEPQKAAEYTIDPKTHIIWYSCEDDLVHVREVTE